MAKWSSGIFDIFGELDVFIYAMFCPNILMVKNSLDVADGKASLVPGLGASIGRAFGMVGCTEYDGAFFVNIILCELTGGLIYVYWRLLVRKKYGIDGNVFGDLIGFCCCMPLTMMQESRELKRHGAGGVPAQAAMH
jgi:Cys-rich protein (TIGR01571 family)